MLAVILPKGEDKLFGALLFQKCKDFKVYVPEDDPLAPEYEARLSLQTGSLNQVQEALCCVLEPGAVPDKDFVRRVLRTAGRHPDFDVYHVNLPETEPFPRKVKVDKLFELTVLEGVQAPLSSFVFRTARLREKAVFRADGSLDPLPTILACAQGKAVRNVWRQTLEWTAPPVAQDPVSVEKRIRERLDFFHWTEAFFGEDDYPLGTGDRLDLIAGEIAKLYPSYTPEELKELMGSFQVSQGVLRKVRASQALNAAIKDRQKQLQQGITADKAGLPAGR